MGGGRIYECSKCQAPCHISCKQTPIEKPVTKNPKKEVRAKATNEGQKNNWETPVVQPKEMSQALELQTLIEQGRNEKSFISAILFAYNTCPLSGQG